MIQVQLAYLAAIDRVVLAVDAAAGTRVAVSEQSDVPLAGLLVRIAPIASRCRTRRLDSRLALPYATCAHALRCLMLEIPGMLIPNRSAHSRIVAPWHSIRRISRT